MAVILLNITALVNKIPGVDLDNVEAGLLAFRKGMKDEITKSGQAAGDAFGDAFGVQAAESQKAVKGGLQEAIQKLRNSRITIQQPETQKVELSEESKKALTAQNKISGLDARSSAGLNFLLQSGVAGNTVEDKQLAAQKQIVKNTAQPGINVVQMGIA